MTAENTHYDMIHVLYFCKAGALREAFKNLFTSAGNLFKISFRASAERVQALPINLRYIYKRVFTGRQPRYIADIYLVVPALAWFVKTTYLKEESKSELNVMLEIG